jgi:ribosome-associated protein
MVDKNVTESKDFPDQPEEISKSQRKREAQDIKTLASRLIALKPAKLAQVPLDEQLMSEIERARNIRSNVARKRQLLYVAKLLRREDVAPLAEALESFDDAARQLTARQHRSEAWRDHLIGLGDPAVGELLEQRRDANAQTIRQLVRNARLEEKKNKPPAAARSLFRLLRELDEVEPLPPLLQT